MSHKDRMVLCRSCRSPKCPNKDCPTCPQCRDVDCAAPGRCGRDFAPVHTSKLPPTKEDLLRFRCVACELIPCTVCGDQPRYAFQNFGRVAGRRRLLLRCMDCSRPPCTVPACSTCRQCRDVECRRTGKCKKPMAPLSPMEQPRSVREKNAFRCRACRYPPCNVCKLRMPTGGTRNRFSKSGKTEWTCGDCLTLAESRKVRAKYAV